MHTFRSHHCGELRAEHEGQRVRLSGWIHRQRNLGALLFLTLRDHYGLTQVALPTAGALGEKAAAIPRETVVRIDGVVRRRPKDGANPKMPTGEIEIEADDIEVLGACDELPFEVSADNPVSEEIRLRHRFLELRRERLHENLVLRSRIIARIRQLMTDQGFLEYQTPILTSSSPEGARDYLVPARVHPGKFYALPQAPQQFKQLLMVSGFDRYFQIAACFRDEAARADRSPGEFYQLDLEMSFATQEDVFAVVEHVLAGVFQDFSDWPGAEPPFRRIPFSEALLHYGSDKPDLRNPLEIQDLSDLFAASDFRAFAGKTVRALAVPPDKRPSRSFHKKLDKHAKSLGAAGLAWLEVDESGALVGGIANFVPADGALALVERCGAAPGSAIYLMADTDAEQAAKRMGEIRTHLGEKLDLIEQNVWRFCWITDFPMYERDEETGEIVFSHNPFSMPQGGMAALEEKDPLEILAYQYDIVCNGHELSSGAVRNHDPLLMYRAFEIAGYERSVVDERFPALQRAFRYGAPPHAGIAPGIDRIVMLLAGEDSIRRVIAFPFNQKAQDLMMGAPSGVTETQLRELHIRPVPPESGARSRS